MRIFDVAVYKQRLLVAPVGDIQFTGSANVGGCSESALRSYLTEIRRLAEVNDAQVAWIGTGDYVDLMSPSNRVRYRASGLYSTAGRMVSSAVSGIVAELAAVLREYMEPHEIVALCYGHHYFTYDMGDNNEEVLPWRDTDVHLACELGMSQREHQGLVHGLGCVTFQFQEGGATYRVLFEHGQGNGQMLAYGLNKLDKIAGGWEGVDAHVMGHVHKIGISKKARLMLDERGELCHRDIMLLTSGTFLRGYVAESVLYPEMKQLPPLPLGSSAVLVSIDASLPTGLRAVGLTL